MSEHLQGFFNEHELYEQSKKINKYRKALDEVYADGMLSVDEAARLKELRDELGLPEDTCRYMELMYSDIARRNESEPEKPVTLEDLAVFYCCDRFDNDGLIWNTIDHTMKKWLELRGEYVESIDGSGYGIPGSYPVAIGDSFTDLLDDYGELHIHEAFADGKLFAFEDDRQQNEFVSQRLNLMPMEDVVDSYTTYFDGKGLRVFFEAARKQGYAVPEYSDDELDTLVFEMDNDPNMIFRRLNVPVNPALNNVSVIFEDGSIDSLTPPHTVNFGEFVEYLVDRVDGLHFQEETIDNPEVVKMIRELSKAYEHAQLRPVLSSDMFRFNYIGDETYFDGNGPYATFSSRLPVYLIPALSLPQPDDGSEYRVLAQFSIKQLSEEGFVRGNISRELAHWAIKKVLDDGSFADVQYYAAPSTESDFKAAITEASLDAVDRENRNKIVGVLSAPDGMPYDKNSIQQFEFQYLDDDYHEYEDATFSRFVSELPEWVRLGLALPELTDGSRYRVITQFEASQESVPGFLKGQVSLELDDWKIVRSPVDGGFEEVSYKSDEEIDGLLMNVVADASAGVIKEVNGRIFDYIEVTPEILADYINSDFDTGFNLNNAGMCVQLFSDRQTSLSAKIDGNGNVSVIFAGNDKELSPSDIVREFLDNVESVLERDPSDDFFSSLKEKLFFISEDFVELSRYKNAIEIESSLDGVGTLVHYFNYNKKSMQETGIDSSGRIPLLSLMSEEQANAVLHALYEANYELRFDEHGNNFYIHNRGDSAHEFSVLTGMELIEKAKDINKELSLFNKDKDIELLSRIYTGKFLLPMECEYHIDVPDAFMDGRFESNEDFAMDAVSAMSEIYLNGVSPRLVSSSFLKTRDGIEAVLTVSQNAIIDSDVAIGRDSNFATDYRISVEKTLPAELSKHWSGFVLADVLDGKQPSVPVLDRVYATEWRVAQENKSRQAFFKSPAYKESSVDELSEHAGNGITFDTMREVYDFVQRLDSTKRLSDYDGYIADFTDGDSRDVSESNRLLEFTKALLRDDVINWHGVTAMYRDSFGDLDHVESIIDYVSELTAENLINGEYNTFHTIDELRDAADGFLRQNENYIKLVSDNLLPDELNVRAAAQESGDVLTLDSFKESVRAEGSFVSQPGQESEFNDIKERLREKSVMDGTVFCSMRLGEYIVEPIVTDGSVSVNVAWPDFGGNYSFDKSGVLYSSRETLFLDFESFKDMDFGRFKESCLESVYSLSQIPDFMERALSPVEPWSEGPRQRQIDLLDGEIDDYGKFCHAMSISTDYFELNVDHSGYSDLLFDMLSTDRKIFFLGGDFYVTDAHGGDDRRKVGFTEMLELGRDYVSRHWSYDSNKDFIDWLEKKIELAGNVLGRSDGVSEPARETADGLQPYRGSFSGVAHDVLDGFFEQYPLDKKESEVVFSFFDNVLDSFENDNPLVVNGREYYANEEPEYVWDYLAQKLFLDEPSDDAPILDIEKVNAKELLNDLCDRIIDFYSIPDFRKNRAHEYLSVDGKSVSNARDDNEIFGKFIDDIRGSLKGGKPTLDGIFMAAGTVLKKYSAEEQKSVSKVLAEKGVCDEKRMLHVFMSELGYGKEKKIERERDIVRGR